MASFDSKDRPSGSEIGLAHDIGSSAEVSTDTNTLENRGSSQKALNVGHTEVVGTLSNGSRSGSYKVNHDQLQCLFIDSIIKIKDELTLKCRSKEANMSSLIARHLLDVGVESSVVTSIDKVLLAELSKSLAIELVLEVLESKRVVQDGGIIDSITLLKRGSSREGGSGNSREGELGEDHDDIGNWG